VRQPRLYPVVEQARPATPYIKPEGIANRRNTEGAIINDTDPIDPINHKAPFHQPSHPLSTRPTTADFPMPLSHEYSVSASFHTHHPQQLIIQTPILTDRFARSDESLRMGVQVCQMVISNDSALSTTIKW
jgi:hypothetical protein